MLKTLAAVVVLAVSGPVMARAEGCAIAGAEPIPEIEALNQILLNRDFTGLATAVNDQIGVNISDGMQKIAALFAAGFDGCTTIAQRRDTGGLVQSVIVFHGKVGPLFMYWRSATYEGKFVLLSFSLNTDMDSVMDKLH